MTTHQNHPLMDIVCAQKGGESRGIYSVCSANQHVLEASFQQAIKDNSPLLIESTCNQVNQYGGYTGMVPNKFAANIAALAKRNDFDQERLILGGDHLGPHVWQDEQASSAMAKARILVRDCVLAGYTKIHLDASMKLADDPLDTPLALPTSAERAADLCYAGEEAHATLPPGAPKACYVVGTEVPLPGGTHKNENEIQVSDVISVQETIETTEWAFRKRGLEDAWRRVIAVVVQPGVDYGDEIIYDYNPNNAASLVRFIENYDSLVYEAHSTDYQTRDALRKMVEDHFAILKVGPALTFAFREAIFALDRMEMELLNKGTSGEYSRVPEVLDRSMLANPSFWKKYYAGSQEELWFARKYSLSDRSRYYWSDPIVQDALARLFHNLKERKIPYSLLSQFMPVQYEKVRSGILPHHPLAWVYDRIKCILADYSWACSSAHESGSIPD